MQTMHWDMSMSVKVETIDLQHQTMFALINELAEAINNKKPRVVIGSSLSKLIVYAEEHFEYEENCMLVTCCEQLHKHTCEHQGLMRKVKALEQEYLAGDDGVAEKTAQVLQLWLQHHIMKIDMQYSQHLVENGFGKTELEMSKVN